MNQHNSIILQSHLRSFEGCTSKEEVVEKLVDGVHDSPVGFAGFIEKKLLDDVLIWHVFDTEQDIEVLELHAPARISREVLAQEVEDIISSCSALLPPVDKLYLHIFPTWSTFVRDRMDSVAGFTPYKNTVLIFVGGRSLSTNAFKETLSHEYLHAQHYNHQEIKTLKDALIFEGLAEHFSEEVVGQKSRYAQSLDSEGAENLLSRITPLLDSTDPELQREIFTRGNQYPLWGGYALGYALVSAYKEKNPSMSWGDLLRTSPLTF